MSYLPDAEQHHVADYLCNLYIILINYISLVSVKYIKQKIVMITDEIFLNCLEYYKQTKLYKLWEDKLSLNFKILYFTTNLC